MSRAIQRAISLTGVLVLANVAPLFAALDATQKQDLAAVEKGLKQIETNLKLAQESAGPGTEAVTGSKARLAQSRLAMAKAPLEQVVGLLARLPADDAQVMALQRRLDAASAGIAALEARLAGKPAGPAPTEGKPKTPPDKPPPAEVKLDYKQEQLAKDVRSYLADIEGLAGGAAEVVKKISPLKDQLAIDHRLVASAANSVTKGRQRAGLVKGRLDQLPANGKGVAELVAQYKEQVAALDAADKVIAPLHKKLSALIDPASYPELETDIKRVQDLAAMYQSADVLTRNFERAAALVTQLPAAAAEAERLAKTYAPLVEQKTPAGERVEKMGEFFRKSHATFSAAAAQHKQSLPAEIEAELAKASKLAETAAAEQKPAFFSGGIPQVVGFAEGKLILLTALDPDGAIAVKAKVEKAKQQLKARESSLKDAIISANELPPNRYAGKDRANLEKLAIATWKKAEPQAEILAIRFPSEQWDRESLLRWENRAWRPTDRSRLQAQLLVKQDKKIAVIRPINLWIDHLNGDKLSAFPLDDAKDTLPPQRYLPMEKVK